MLSDNILPVTAFLHHDGRCIWGLAVFKTLLHSSGLQPAGEYKA
jgi:hypothetical protein